MHNIQAKQQSNTTATSLNRDVPIRPLPDLLSPLKNRHIPQNNRCFDMQMGQTTLFVGCRHSIQYLRGTLLGLGGTAASNGFLGWRQRGWRGALWRRAFGRRGAFGWMNHWANCGRCGARRHGLMGWSSDLVDCVVCIGKAMSLP